MVQYVLHTYPDQGSVLTPANFQDILPLLLAPGPTVPLHAQSALTSIYQNMADLPPHAQLRALSHAVRWECGIASQDFLSNMLEGERWLVWAASNVGHLFCWLLAIVWI